MTGLFNVLIFCRRPATVRDAAFLAQFLRKDPRFTVVLVAGNATISDSLRAIQSETPIVALSHSKGPVRESVPAPETRLGFKDRLKSSLLSFGPSRAFLIWRGIRLDRIRAQRAYSDANANAVVVFDDRAIRPEMVWLDEASKKNMPRILLAFASSSIDGDFENRRSKCEYWPGPIGAFLTKLILPQNILTWRGSKVLFHDLWALVGARAAGLRFNKPWVPGGGNITAFALPSIVDIEEPILMGVSPELLHPVGRVSLDEIGKLRATQTELKIKLADRYRVSPIGKLVVCAVPQNAEHGLVKWAEHQAQTDALFQSLRHPSDSVILSLHPKSDRKDYQAAADRLGLPIAVEPLADLLPAADIFVCGASSTIQWATSMGIPTVLWNPLHVQTGVYEQWPGVSIANEGGELSDSISKLVQQSDHYDREVVLALSAPGNLKLDGRACERVASLIYSQCLAMVAEQGTLKCIPS